MGQPAAKQGDQMMGVDVHIVMIPSPAGEVPTPMPHPFTGKLDTNLSTSVKIQGKPAAMLGSIATNNPAHIPQGPRFMVPPLNKSNVMLGSFTVMINKKPAARLGDIGLDCGDPPAPTGSIVPVGVPKVMIG